MDGQIPGQVDWFGAFVKKEEPKKHRRLEVGDRISRVVLGECEVTTITEVEGNDEYYFYRTDSGLCYDAKDADTTVDEDMATAERDRSNYITVEPEGLSDRLTVVYSPRKCDGKVLWAQLGIWEGMLFWKEKMTYQFLEKLSEKELKKEYKKHKEKILEDMERNGGEIVDREMPMERLYLCVNGRYASAEYTMWNKAERRRK